MSFGNKENAPRNRKYEQTFNSPIVAKAKKGSNASKNIATKGPEANEERACWQVRAEFDSVENSPGVAQPL